VTILHARLKRLFWRVRYAIYNRDVDRALREGRGTRENPLTWLTSSHCKICLGEQSRVEPMTVFRARYKTIGGYVHISLFAVPLMPTGRSGSSF
jgi:hypothetical protein